MKRILSIVLVVALLAVSIPLQTLTVSAASNIVINGVDIGYADGSYFTKNGKSCANSYWSNGRCHKNDVCVSATSSQCNCMRYWPTGSPSTCQVDLLASQCFGFARYCQWKVYGYFDASATSYFTDITGSLSASSCTESTLKSKLLGCAPATHVRLKGGHSVSIVNTTSYGADVADCNYNGYCIVRFKTYSWAELATYFKSYSGVEYANAWNKGGVVTTHKVDSSYNKNLIAYPKSKITAEYIFDANHRMVNSTCWIGTTDKCTIVEVYTDGCCLVTYPLDTGGTKTVYSKIALFNISDGSHTCNKGQYMYYEAAHPHYSCYKCSVCGNVWRNTAETNVVSGCSSCDTNSCKCSTSYAGTYTTKNVSSELRIRDAHSTNGNVVGYIPANATFTVSKANGSWAHVTYNGKSGYVSYEYIQKVTPNTIDTRYPTPFKAYTLKNANQPAYDAVNGNNVGNIYATDLVTIEAVYTNGWVKATCPWTGYSNGRTIYAPLSTFLDTSFTLKTIQATTKTQCYYRSDLSSSPGYIYAEDSCVQVGQSGNYVCVLCPWNTGGYYLVWSNKSAFAHTHSYDSWSKYDGTYHSRNCACGNVEKQAHTWNSGTVTKQATCTAAGVKTYTCTVCKATKTETIAVKEHTWNNGTVTMAATCGANGIRTYKCSGCNGTFEQEIPATGKHTYDNDCDTTCNVCNDIRTVGVHTYNSVVTAPATCGEDGVMTYTCSICSRSYTETVPATGEHAYDDEYDATCNACGAVREVPEKPVDPGLPEDAPAFVVESVSASAGEEFTVAVRTERNSGIVSLKLQVSYDTDLLELVGAEELDFEDTVFSPITKTPFIINWVDALRPNNTTDGVVALLTFRVKEGAAVGATEIAVSYNSADVFDEDFEDVAFRTVSGTVEIVEYTLGDIDDDGVVNNKDLARLQQHLSGWEVSVNAKASDVTGDGTVNNKDLARLQQYLSGWDVTLG